MINDYTQASGELALVNSPVDARRFNLSVSRMNVPHGHLASDEEVVKKCRRCESQLLILRYPTSRVQLANQLARGSDQVMFQADTLVYFSKDLGSKSVDSTNTQKLNDWNFRKADAADNNEIHKLSEIIFEDYPNHYRANSRLRPEDIRDGYVEWAQVGLLDQKRLTVIVEDRSANKVGFALVAFDGDLAEIELNGIHPDAQGQGAYSALLEWLLSHLAERGVKKLCISTQIQNERVIRAWIRSGFNLEFSLNTVHLMPRN